MPPMPDPTDSEIRGAVEYMIYVIDRYGERYRPILDSLIADLEAHQRSLPPADGSIPKRLRQPREPVALEPRCLTIADAAAYCGLTPCGFRHWVSIGRLPPSLPGTHRWDRKAIDFALDQLSGLPSQIPSEPEENDYDRWKRQYDAREAEVRNPELSLRGPRWRRVPK